MGLIRGTWALLEGPPLICGACVGMACRLLVHHLVVPHALAVCRWLRWFDVGKGLCSRDAAGWWLLGAPTPLLLCWVAAKEVRCVEALLSDGKGLSCRG